MKRSLKNWAKKICFSMAERVAFQPYDPRRHAVRELCVPPSALSCFNLSANNIKLVRTDEGISYFREMICRVPLTEFLSALLDDYFFLLESERRLDNFTQEVPIEIQFPVEVREAFAAYVARCRCQPDFFRRLSRLKDVVQREGYSMWQRDSRLTPQMVAEFGFPDCPEALMRVFPDFVAFMKSGMEQYRRSSMAGRGGMDVFNACRSLATKEIADALGLGYLIPRTEVVLLSAGTARMYGVLCSRCPGMRAKDAPWEPSPALQRALADLQVLDALCGQNDHWVNNYNVYERDGRAAGAMAFDNDNMWAFFPTPRLSFPSKGGGDPLLGAGGLLRLPHLSAETAQCVSACDAAALCNRVKLYLNPLQRMALRVRLHALQRALRRTEAKRADFLLADDEWTEETLQEELSGAHGHTYTCLYATTRDCCALNAARKA